MKKKQLGCLTTGGWIALILALIIAGASYAATGSQMFSPGELNAQRSGTMLNGFSSHDEFGGECSFCHTAPWAAANMSDKCIDCHQGLIPQLADKTTLHGGAMSKMNNQDCRVCHTDHNGKHASMTQFLEGDFPHELVGFGLGSHERISWNRKIVCADCHQDGFMEFSLIVCIDCHDQIDQSLTAEHRALFKDSCLACHDGIETYGADFDHDSQIFPLEGKHTNLNCDACHRGATSLTMLQNTPQTCLACHKKADAHQGLLGKECGICHNPSGWKPALYDHTPTGFELIGGHAEVTCEECHQNTTFQGADPACISCHASQDPHNRNFGANCSLCHTIFSWSEVHFDHNGTYAQDCISCHQGDSPSDHYPGQCSACHISDAWLPANFNHEAAGATDCLTCHTGDRPANHYGGQCSACHSTTAWLPASYNHTFPINHEGARSRCELCHVDSNYSTYTCYGCHEHTVSNIQSEHKRISDLNNCIKCHWDGREHDDHDDDDDDD